MTSNLLVIYEITQKAAQVHTKKAYMEFERWVREVLQTYQDAAIEKVARIHLFKLKEELSF